MKKHNHHVHALELPFVSPHTYRWLRPNVKLQATIHRLLARGVPQKTVVSLTSALHTCDTARTAALRDHATDRAFALAEEINAMGVSL